MAESNSYRCNAVVTLVQGGPGTGKTERLVSRVGELLAGGCDPADVLVVVPSTSAAQALHDRMVCSCDNGAAGVAVTTPMTLALQGLAEPGARAFTGGRVHRLAAFEENFFLEDMRVTGQKQRRLREMLKFLERGWSEMRDDEDGWLITGEERAVNAFARENLAGMGALHPSEVTATYVRYVACEPEVCSAVRRPHVLVDDLRVMSRASQRLVRLLAGETLFATWNPLGGLKGEEPYGYDAGLEELFADVCDSTCVDLRESRLAGAPQAVVANLYAQECLADRGLAAPEGSAEAAVGVFEELHAECLCDEMPLLAQRVQGLVWEGVRPEEIFLFVPTDAWARRACAALERVGVPASRIEERQAVGGDIRDISKCEAALVYTALHLVTDPTSPAAWRCWCGFGDYLGCSASMTRLARLAVEAATTLPELLAALDAGELACEAVDVARVLDRYRAGRRMIEDAQGLMGPELLGTLSVHAFGKDAVPGALAELLGSVGPNEDAQVLYERAAGSLLSPVFVPGTVRVGGFDAALGQAPRVLVCCGMANGLVPPTEYFELTQATIEAQDKMHAQLVERLASLVGKAGEGIICTTFEKAGIVEAEALKLKTERVRLRNGRRVCDLGSSVCLDYLAGRKLAYVR